MTRTKELITQKLREAMDTAVLQNPRHNPPAIVFNVTAPAPQQSGPQFSTNFINYLKTLENGIREGFRGARWYPFKDPNGSFMVVAYGHKLKPGENFSGGITEAQAHDLLMDDLLDAWNLSDQWLKEKYSRGMNSLPRTGQEMLTDFAFNLGTLGTFPQFVTAVVNGDLQTMKQEYERSYRDMHGVKRIMTNRNKAFADLFFN